MQFGAVMFPTDYAMPPDELARALEERGFESVWFPEHTHIPASRRSPWPGVPRGEVDQRRLAAGGQQQGGPSGQGPDVLGGQDALPAQADALASVPVAVIQAAHGYVVVSDQAGDVLGEAGVVQTGPDQLNGRGRP